eukprot:TRINITY_DN6429_c0_g1_i2.p2 TRINITY_DN6429_c0_g1~~TRINITY_DN6429_c0_g1_i2.p2  ORF type:complete len:227 (-),score=30.39 TRINITY_DN6429_c0_g1_i2:554-1177(-)
MMLKFLVLYFCGLHVQCLGQISVSTTETVDEQIEVQDTGAPETEVVQDEDVILLLDDSTSKIEREEDEEGEVVFPGFESLTDFQWQNRLVLVFTPSEDFSSLQEQRRVIECNQRGYQDRSLRVIEVIGNQVKLDGVQIDSPPASEMRLRFGVSNDQFQTVLIGLDGGSKLVSKGVLSAEFLFDEIDVMPMRRQQISSQGFSVPGVDC